MIPEHPKPIHSETALKSPLEYANIAVIRTTTPSMGPEIK